MNAFLENVIDTGDTKAIADAMSKGTEYYLNMITGAIKSIKEIDAPLLLVALEITKQNVIRINPLAGQLADSMMERIDIPTIVCMRTLQPEE